MPESFPERVTAVLAAKVGYRCSRPTCGAATSGPRCADLGSFEVGVAARITGAAPGGPRFDPSLSDEDCRAESNGIWLCRNCAELVDSDPGRYTVRSLRTWKTTAEMEAQIRLGRIGRGEGAPLAPVEIELLYAAARDGDIWVLGTPRGTRVHVGDRDLRSDRDPLVETVQLDALDTLARRGLVRQMGTTHYKLTAEGFRVARVLAGEPSPSEADAYPVITRRRRRRSIGEAWTEGSKPYLIENISSTGALLQTDRPIEKGQVLELDLALEGGSRVHVTAEVVRVQPPDWGRVGGVGVTFKEFHGASRRTLEEWAGMDWDPPR